MKTKTLCNFSVALACLAPALAHANGQFLDLMDCAEALEILPDQKFLNFLGRRPVWTQSTMGNTLLDAGPPIATLCEAEVCSDWAKLFHQEEEPISVSDAESYLATRVHTESNRTFILNNSDLQRERESAEAKHAQAVADFESAQKSHGGTRGIQYLNAAKYLANATKRLSDLSSPRGFNSIRIKDKDFIDALESRCANAQGDLAKAAQSKLAPYRAELAFFETLLTNKKK